MNSPKPSPRPAGNNQKSPSYLSRVKDELYQLIITDHASDEQDAKQITESLWNFFRPKIAESFWNGVSAGASGRTKPKSDRPAPGKTYRLTGGSKDKAISNGNTWSESEVTEER